MAGDQICRCARRWPIQNKLRSNCRACEWEYKHPGQSYEEHLRNQQQATQNKMRARQLQRAGSTPRPQVSRFGAGAVVVIDESYARHLDSVQRKPPKPRTRIAPVSKKGTQQIQEDNRTYARVWEMRLSDCCENCGCYIGSDLTNESGKVIDRFRFSHILSKGAYPEHRNNPLNFNLLCFDCHQLWEFGDNVARRGMAIWAQNKIIIAGLFRMEVEAQALAAGRFED